MGMRRRSKSKMKEYKRKQEKGVGGEESVDTGRLPK